MHMIEKAINQAPSCVLIDDIDLFFPPRATNMDEASIRLTTTALRLIDKAISRNVNFIGSLS